MLLLRICIKLVYQNAWDYLSFIYNIFFVGEIMPSIVSSWKLIETKWYFVPFSIDTKESIFKRKNQFEQQIFHCSKKFEIVKSCESSFLHYKIAKIWLLPKISYTWRPPHPAPYTISSEFCNLKTISIWHSKNYIHTMFFDVWPVSWT